MDPSSEVFTVVVEIPKGSRNKYEYDHESGAIFLDRMLFTSVALLKGAGFRLEGYSRRCLKISGRWRDHERWAILAEDRPRRAGRSGRTT